MINGPDKHWAHFRKQIAIKRILNIFSEGVGWTLNLNVFIRDFKKTWGSFLIGHQSGTNYLVWIISPKIPILKESTQSDEAEITTYSKW